MPDYHGWTHAPKSAGGTDPIPTTDQPGIWGYCLWNDSGMTIANGSWEFPPDWTETWISDEAYDNGWIANRDPGEFGLEIHELNNTGGVWHCDVRAQFDDSLGTLSYGDWLGVGNLAGVGFSLGNGDVHNFFDGKLVTQQADDNTVAVTTTRVVAGTGPFLARNILAEVGAFTATSGHSVNLNQIELTVVRLAPGPSTERFNP